MQIGFHASHEQWSPSALLRWLREAEQAGFRAAMCSDHFHPWISRYGASGFAWSWLGAAVTQSSLSFGTVCAPGQRYHPAVIAQGAATLADLAPGRVWLAVGSGEALNEHITGAPWPPKPERNARLKECVDVMRALWKGETVTHRGRVVVEETRLYTLPPAPIPVIGAALSPETARWMGGWADGLITAGSEPSALRRIVEAFREGGGSGKPLLLQTAVAYAPTQEEAMRIAREEWPQAVLSSQELSDLATPGDFERATAQVSCEEVASRLRVSADLAQHVEWLRQDVALGFDAVYLHLLGRDLGPLLETFGKQVLPHFRGESKQPQFMPGER